MLLVQQECPFYRLFVEKYGIAFVRGSEVEVESELSRRFRVCRIQKYEFLSFM